MKYTEHEPVLEMHLYSELDLAGRAGAADHAEVSGVGYHTLSIPGYLVSVRVRGVKVRPVEKVEKLCTEIEPRVLRNRQAKLLMKTQIEIKVVGASGEVSAGVTERRVRQRRGNALRKKVVTRWVRAISSIDRIARYIRPKSNPA